MSRKIPDLEFVDTDLEILKETLIKAGEYFTGRTLHKGDPVRLFILWMADIFHQHNMNINYAAKQNIPRFAEGKYLDELGGGGLFNNTTRLQESAATTTLKFTLSAPQVTAWTAPKGTRATPDGSIHFETMEDLQILAGKLSGIVKAKCMKRGEVGNGFLPGQIKQGVDILPFQQSVENTTTSEGGADVEDDDAYYQRIRESMEEYSTAGPEGAYKAHAKKASQLIVDVGTYSPEPGIADIRILLKDGKLPGQEIIDAVYEKLNDDKVRPFTDFVQVSAPDVIPFDVDLTFYTHRYSEDSLVELPEKVNKMVNDYILWQTETMGRDINPSKLTSMLMATGIKRVEIHSPSFTVLKKIEVGQLSTLNVINGGIEDE